MKTKWWWTLLIIFVVVMSLLIFSSNKNKGEDLAFSLHWACMDGCYNMLLVEYPETYSQYQHLHTNCTELCTEQYLSETKGEKGK